MAVMPYFSWSNTRLLLGGPVVTFRFVVFTTFVCRLALACRLRAAPEAFDRKSGPISLLDRTLTILAVSGDCQVRVPSIGVEDLELRSLGGRRDMSGQLSSHSRPKRARFQ